MYNIVTLAMEKLGMDQLDGLDQVLHCPALYAIIYSIAKGVWTIPSAFYTHFELL